MRQRMRETARAGDLEDRASPTDARGANPIAPLAVYIQPTQVFNQFFSLM